MINAFIWLAGGNLIVPTSFQMHETRTSLNDDHAHVEIIFYLLTFVNRVRALVVKVRLLLFSYLLSPRRSRKVGRKVPIYLPTYRVENHSKSTEWHTGKIARDGVRERERACVCVHVSVGHCFKRRRRRRKQRRLTTLLPRTRGDLRTDFILRRHVLCRKSSTIPVCNLHN